MGSLNEATKHENDGKSYLREILDHAVPFWDR